MRRGAACGHSGSAKPASHRLTRHRIHSGGSRDSALLANTGNPVVQNPENHWGKLSGDSIDSLLVVRVKAVAFVGGVRLWENQTAVGFVWPFILIDANYRRQLR